MTMRMISLLLVVTLSSCGQGSPTDAVSGPEWLPQTGRSSSGDEVAAVTRNRSIVTVDRAGAVRQLAELPADIGEPDAVVVSEDGRLVLVSAVRWLVVRKLDSGAEAVVLSLKDAPVGATPPSWPVSWSPDGTQIAHVLEDGAVVTDVETGRTAPLAAGRDRTVLAPVWLPDGRLLVMEGCCIGGGTMVSADTGEAVLPVHAPLRSARTERDRGVGIWLALEEDGLVRTHRATSTQVLPDVLVASG
jgi:hypothetical protein